MAIRRAGSFRQQLYALDKQLQKELMSAATAYGEEVQVALTRGLSNWKGKAKVNFYLDVKQDARRIYVNVIPAGRGTQIFLWVSGGTGQYGPKKRAYQIPKVPRPEVTLRFQTGYSAKTRPPAVMRAGTGKKSGPWRSAKVVMHPGIRPRKFISTLLDATLPQFRRDVENAYRRAARRARS